MATTVAEPRTTSFETRSRNKNRVARKKVFGASLISILIAFSVAPAAIAAAPVSSSRSVTDRVVGAAKSTEPFANPMGMSAPHSGDAQKVADKTAGADLAFVENQGQLDPRVRYYIQGGDTSLYFTDRGLRMSLSGAGMSDPSKNAGTKRWVIDHAFLANPVRPVATRRDRMTVSYFKGPRADWHTGLPTFQRITYPNVWPGIDLVYSGTGQALKYDLIVHPGADPKAIALSYRYARRVQQTARGALKVTTPIGSFTEKAPIAYQRHGGARVEVPAGFDTVGQSYGFKLGAYEAARTLVIDPEVVIYAGYIGGAGIDFGASIAVDSSGAAYVTGYTESTAATFPESGGAEPTLSGSNDAFVVKVTPDGSALDYAGYIGGSGID
ncbi:MAG: hypothetical protein QOC87_581 [Actinomycetota bacterium]|nr:hypothetical protein [Actinomycetota bacterium]